MEMPANSLFLAGGFRFKEFVVGGDGVGFIFSEPPISGADCREGSAVLGPVTESGTYRNQIAPVDFLAENREGDGNEARQRKEDREIKPIIKAKRRRSRGWQRDI